MQPGRFLWNVGKGDCIGWYKNSGRIFTQNIMEQECMRIVNPITAADPVTNRTIEDVIRDFVRTSPMNRLEAFDNTQIFNEPLVGFADGDDPIFTEYKTVVSEKHLTPREALALHDEEGRTALTSPLPLSVISFVLPIDRGTRSSNALEEEGPSLRWNHTRWKGQEFIDELERHLVSFLEKRGVSAIAPDLTSAFKIDRFSGGIASNWSQRHMAYAAGLGTFSLNEGFITPRGMAMRCGSVVAGIKLTPSIRPYAGPFANCLFFSSGTCGACIRRCPGGAISEKGHDKSKCLEVLFVSQKPWIEGAHGEGYIGQYAGCGLCQTGVPCEDRIPVEPIEDT